MSLAIIVAMANNRAIGKNNQLLWYLPEDLKYFKRITMGKPMIMGRKTFESIGRPLPGRLNIVVTRQQDWDVNDRYKGSVRVVHSLPAAIQVAEAQAFLDGIEEVMMIGGGELYQEALPYAEKLYLTRVDTELDADTFFPAFDENQWQESSREAFQASDNNPYDYAFCVLEKRIP